MARRIIQVILNAKISPAAVIKQAARIIRGPVKSLRGVMF